MSGATHDDGGGVNVGAGTSNSSPSLPVIAPNAAKRRKRSSKEDNSDDDDAESVVEVENDDEDEDSDGRVDNFSEVHVETFRAHYDIKIRNFCQAINEKPRVTWKFRNPNRGNSRPPTPTHNYQLRIDVIPNDDENSGRSCLRGATGLVGVHYTNDSATDLKFRVETKILNVSRQLDIKSSTQLLHPGQMVHHRNLCPRLSPGIARNALNGTITISIDIDVTVGLRVESSRRICVDSMRAPHKRLVEDCTRMRDKSAFSDVTLKVGERSSFPCSKFILAARSEVFRAMFELPMRESIENEVRIEDAEPSAVEDMLEYVYTDGIIHLSLTRAVSLLQLSERYAMHGLSLFCCEALSKNLTVDTVCKIAAVAEQHSLRDLKEKAINFMYFHAGRVIRTDGWQSLLASCPDIANSVVRRLSEFHDESVSARMREERSFGGNAADPFFPINLMHGMAAGDNVPVYQHVIPVNAAVAAGPDPGGPGQNQGQPVNPEEEELPLYPQFAVQHLDEDEADNIWVADGHAIEVGVAEVHAAGD